MASTVQEISGLHRALDRLEARIKVYRDFLLRSLHGADPSIEIEQIAVGKGEVETLESLVRRISQRLLGAEPSQTEWEPLHHYCSRNEDKKGEYQEQNIEYFRWALLWIQKTRMYIDYLSGLQHAVGEPRDAEAASTKPSIGRGAPRYDVALSFAGEDRAHARKIAELARERSLSVFYDEYEQATLWGRNLYTHLSDIYQNKAEYCIIFVSANYARKLWTKREREAAQARAFKESREYILPLRLDDTAIPGIEDTVGYIDLRVNSYEDVLSLLLQKLERNKHPN